MENIVLGGNLTFLQHALSSYSNMPIFMSIVKDVGLNEREFCIEMSMKGIFVCLQTH